MHTLREVVEEYQQSHKALGHFNFSDSNQLQAIAGAAQECNLPVIAGLSEGERAYFPLAHARALVNLYRAQGVAIYLNADHTYSLEKAKEAIDARVDSIVVDGAKLSFDDNVSLVQGVVSYARAAGRDVLVEGELGYIGASSAVMETIPEGVAVGEERMTKPEELHELVQKTGIDLVAPAVGNIHGVVKSGQPKLSVVRIAQLAAAAGVPLVLHGGSGSADEEFTEAVKAGIVMIHINTDLRVLYREQLKHTLDTTHETTPYKFLAPAAAAMQAYVAQKIKLFAGA